MRVLEEVIRATLAGEYVRRTDGEDWWVHPSGWSHSGSHHAALLAGKGRWNPAGPGPDVEPTTFIAVLPDGDVRDRVTMSHEYWIIRRAWKALAPRDGETVHVVSPEGRIGPAISDPQTWESDPLDRCLAGIGGQEWDA